MSYSATYAAKWIGISSSRVRKLADEHIIGVKVSNVWVFTKGELYELRDCRLKSGQHRVKVAT